ncbi:MAG TPA: pentapeptide repeat-containing protein [Terriglobia bacterium]|nr:pentapeptide repeat-containing protein [Terriglobia bacterium]
MNDPQQPNPPELGDATAKQHIEEEARLRIEKLKLERGELRFQASWKGRTFEFLKAFTGVAAIIAAIAGIISVLLTYRSTNKQLAELTSFQVEERFDKDVSRLGGNSPSVRLAGVSGLQIFLQSGGSSRQRAALLFLANSAAVEEDETVRGAILDTFASLGRYRVPRHILDEALRVERDRNRGILRVLQARFRDQLGENDKLLFEKGNDEARIGKLNAAQLGPLRATAAMVAALIRDGAYVKDLSRIYCVSCDFSPKNRRIDLSGSKFDNSYLRRAIFRNAKLENASFDGAYLTRTDFTNADLRNADFTSPPLADPPIQAILVRKALSGAEGPIFECADLSGADFTGSVLFGFYWTDIYGAGYFPRFYGANLRGADLESFKVFTAVPQRLPGTHGGMTVVNDPLHLKFAQAGGYNILVRGWQENDYMIRTYEIGKNFKFDRPIPRKMWPSIYIGLNSLASAKNFSAARMPEGLRHFIEANKAAFSHPAIYTTCPPSSSP